MSRSLSVFFLTGLALLLACPLLGQGVLKNAEITPSSGNFPLTITFQNVASNPDTGLAEIFVLEASTNLASGFWFPQPATFPSVPGRPGYFSTTVPSSLTGPQRFYRVKGFLRAVDTDRDGLADFLEAQLGTNPNRPDTDGDGFSDGQEYAYGTKPLDKNSNLVRSQLPTVSFLALNSRATEGTSPYQLPLAFDRPYVGTLNYKVNSLSTAKPGTDFTLGGSPTATNGSIAVNGTTAAIPLTLLDDANVSGQRALIIDLQLNGNNYIIGGRASHVVLLSDNDAWWTGNLIPATGEVGARTFRLKITHQGATVAATFGAGVGQDGLPVPAALGPSTASVSTAIFPIGQWPGTAVRDATNIFQVISPEVTAARRAGSVLAGSQPMGRRLELNAQPRLNATNHFHSLKANAYFGDYTEVLTRGGATIAKLRGTFVLVRDTPAPLPVLSNLLP